MSQVFASGGQSIGVSASTLVLPVNTQDRSVLLGWYIFIIFTLDQWFSPGGSFVPLGTLGHVGDIFDCHNLWRADAAGI